jgi:hypothetical protein
MVAVDGVIVGVGGVENTSTFTEDGRETHPAALVAVKLYRPVLAELTPEMVGF